MKRQFLLFLATLFTLLSPRSAKAVTYCTPWAYYAYLYSYDMCSSYGSYTCNQFTLSGYSGTNINYVRNCSDAVSSTARGYFDRTGTDSCQLQQGGTYSGNIYVSTYYYHTNAIWIDFNDDGNFDLTEQVFFANSNTTTYLSPGFSFTVPITAPVGRHRMRMRSCYTSSYTVVPAAFDPCAYYVSSPSYVYYYYGNGMDFTVNVVAAPACSAAPTVTTVPSGNASICSGGTMTLTGSAGIFSGMGIRWQSGTSATGPWTDITGATNYTYTTPAITSCQYFRLVDTCRPSGNIGYSSTITVCPGSPKYAVLPYFQDFEAWQNYCAFHDVPDTNWKTTPSYGNASWRRQDEGSTAGWSSTYSINYYWGGSAYKSGTHAACFHSSGYYYNPPSTDFSGDLDMYLDCSGSTGTKLIQFYWQNQPGSTPIDYYDQDSLYVRLSTDGGTSFNTIWNAPRYNPLSSPSTWPVQRLDIPTNSATTIVRFHGVRRVGMPGTSYPYYGTDYSDIGVDSVYVAPPCNGTPPTPTLSPTGTTSACAGAKYSLTAGGLPLAGGYKYTWQASTDGGTTWANTGDTQNIFNTPNLWSNIQYRVQVQCPYAGTAVTSAATIFNISNSPSYFPTLPYTESFERFQNRCGTADAFSPYTAVYPVSGYVSWRRDDKGSTAGWYYGYTYSPYAPGPISVDSSYCAHVETYYYTNGPQSCDMFAFVNCSSPVGNKEINFYAFVGPSQYSYTPSDTLIAYYSVDSGAHFTRLGAYPTTSGWEYKYYTLPSNSPKTVIRFNVQHPYGNYYYSVGGIGLDKLQVLPPCTGKPSAGTFPTSVPCANQKFTVSLKGYSLAAGLKFQWQKSPDNTTWVNTSATDTLPTLQIALPTAYYLRAIVTCSNSGQSDTTAPQYFTMKPFYYCYCDPDTLKSGGTDYIYYGFTNVAITKKSGDTVLNNGNPSPVCSNPRVYSMYIAGASAHTPHAGYTNWDTLRRLSHRMYLDSLYNFYITLGYYSGCYFYKYPINIYIDYNHSATFDASEKVFDKTDNGSSTSLPHAQDSIRIPHTAQVGLTGMRILYGYALSGSPLDPCGPATYHYSEVQDYLVDLEYRPCNGPVNAGTAVSTDTNMCAGYSFRITDTTHEYQQSGIVSFWQYSNDGVVYGPMAGTTNRDTVSMVFSTTTWYRMAMVCGNSHDTTYSVPVKVKQGPPYMCYCYSMAIGGNKYDSSDIGAFTIGKFVINKKGPHVLNPVATGSHTNYTGTTIHLAVDSTYAVGVYHILRSKTHGDGKVTMFIDYNNNFQYDIPEERVWTGYTSATDWYITTSITVPKVVIAGVPTGMRLIINNNTAPNVPSDSACGVYTSGETQDYVVQFDWVWPAGVGNIAGIENLNMYPNPTSGKFNVSFTTSKVVNKLQINVTNMTGQVVMQRLYNNTSGKFNTELDMTDQPRGLYFVEFMADGERMIRKLVVR